MAEGRRDSVGTLTGWQLLAKQVADDDDDRDADSAGGSSQGDDAEAATDNSRKRLHVRSLSNTSNLSEESGLGAPSAVTPRPHQWLYKEYKVLDEIGSGGFGRVCRARRLADGGVVVVKEINTTSLSAKQKSATMDEVTVLSKLNHPNIVKYHDCYMDAVYINIVMEYCNGGDLAGLIKGRAGKLMPEAEVMSLFVQICLAMHYVHTAGVLHRDLKSSNVLITRADNYGGMPLLKLGDFGVAKMNSADTSMASTIVGTPQYLSPEMCENKPYGKKSDVWALGCILYELCCLTKAFDMGSGGISGIFLKIMRGTYEPLPPAYSDELKALVGAMLQVKPRRRPSVTEVLHMPYVQGHLALYLDWARNVPQAHPQVLLSSLGDLWPRRGQQDTPQQQQQQQQQHGAAIHSHHSSTLETIGSGGSCSSLDATHAGAASPTQQPAPPLPPAHQQQQQQAPAAEQQQDQQQQSSPHALYAASSRAATPASRQVSNTGSNSSFNGPASGSALSSTDMLLRQGSNMSASARSGSVTPRSIAAAAAVPSAAAAAAAPNPSQLAPAGSSATMEQQLLQQQQQQQGGGQAPGGAAATSRTPSPAAPPCSPMTTASSAASSPLGSSSTLPAASGPSGGPPPGSLSGWLGGDTSLQKRQQIQQQVLAAQQHNLDLALQATAAASNAPQASAAAAAAAAAAGAAAAAAAGAGESQGNGATVQGSQQQLPDLQVPQPLELSPELQQQQQQRRPPRMSCPNPGELLLDDLSTQQQQQQQQGGDEQDGVSPPLPLEPPLAAAAAAATSRSADGLATAWAYPMAAAAVPRPQRVSLYQEQLDGLKAIWDLKAKLGLKPDPSGIPGGQALLREHLGRPARQQQEGEEGEDADGSLVLPGPEQQQQQQAAGLGHYWAIAEADAAMHI